MLILYINQAKIKKWKNFKKFQKKVLTSVYLYGSIHLFAADSKFEANGDASERVQTEAE